MRSALLPFLVRGLFNKLNVLDVTVSSNVLILYLNHNPRSEILSLFIPVMF